MHDWSQFISELERGSVHLNLHSFNGYRRYSHGFKNKARLLPFHRIHLVTVGSIKRELGQDKFTQKAGRLVWQFPNTKSQFDFPSSSEFYGLHFDMDFSDNLNTLSNQFCNNYISLSEALHFSRDLQEICTLYNQNRSLNSLRIQLRLSDLLCHIIQDSYFPYKNNSLNGHQRIIIRDYVHENCDREIHSHEIAPILNYSTDYFSRLFKQNYGLTFRRYQMQERVRMAGMELITGESGISHIAEKHGYDDLALFSRQFKLVMGMPPRKYRNTILS